MQVKFDELLLAFEFVSSSGGFGEHEAFMCRQTGKIYWRTGDSDLDEVDEELPDDIEDGQKYIAIPNKHELDLGKPLVLRFADECLPDDFDQVRYMFSKKGAYQKFKSLLERRRVLERWYEFEAKETERALRRWCKDNSIAIVE